MHWFFVNSFSDTNQRHLPSNFLIDLRSRVPRSLESLPSKESVRNTAPELCPIAWTSFAHTSSTFYKTVFNYVYLCQILSFNTSQCVSIELSQIYSINSHRPRLINAQPNSATVPFTSNFQLKSSAYTTYEKYSTIRQLFLSTALRQINSLKKNFSSKIAQNDK